MADEIEKGLFGIRGKSFPVNTPEEIADALYQDHNVEAECQVIDAIGRALKHRQNMWRTTQRPRYLRDRKMRRKMRKAERQAKRRNR